mmetsp:Transcript_69670/g.150116  ORF Transcript_69670/g.150116 Transcript_69670/m.150116 type:complete len:148 (+) Transcript_69670:261-704(+)
MRINSIESNITIRHNETHKKISEMDTNLSFYNKKFVNIHTLIENNNTNIISVGSDLSTTNDKIVKQKSDLVGQINSQWKELVAMNQGTESKITELKDMTSACINLGNENNSTIEMVQSMLKDLQDLCDKNKVDINSLTNNKVNVDSY